MRVSIICIVCNLMLCGVKLVGGLAAHSEALVSDGVNSAFDVVSGVIVIIGAWMSRIKPDDDHPYGHERFESVASVVLSVVLFVTAVFMGHTAIEDLIAGAYKEREMPGMLSLVAALISIITKEIMFRFTKGNAEKINSLSLKAAAWDHRADMISTAFALVGVMISQYGFPVADIIASLIVCVFIARTAYKVFREAMGQMVDKTCDPEKYGEIRDSILSVDGVLGIDLLQVRTFGNRLYVDLEISEDGCITLNEAHEVAEDVHREVEMRFPEVKHIMIHVNPKDGEETGTEE